MRQHCKVLIDRGEVKKKIYDGMIRHWGETHRSLMSCWNRTHLRLFLPLNRNLALRSRYWPCLLLRSFNYSARYLCWQR